MPAQRHSARHRVGLYLLLALPLLGLLTGCTSGGHAWPVVETPVSQIETAHRGPLWGLETPATAQAPAEAESPLTRGLLFGRRPPSPAPTPPAAWLVSRFDEGDHWLGQYREYDTGQGDWSKLLAREIADRLRENEDRVYTMNRELSPAQIQQLISQGLRYRLHGSMKQLTHHDRQVDGFTQRQGRLVVTYQLQRRLGSHLQVVQTDRLQTEVRIADRIQPRHLNQLIEQMADQVTEAVQLSYARDIMGMVE